MGGPWLLLSLEACSSKLPHIHIQIGKGRRGSGATEVRKGIGEDIQDWLKL
jgi:hypothetical protein